MVILGFVCLMQYCNLFSVGTNKKFPVKIEPVIGELLQAGNVSEAGFKTLKGT